jgi:hypothetical protein
MCIGGGGGDDGLAQRAEQRALAEQQRVRDAITKVNTMFGVTPTAAPTAADFTTAAQPGWFVSYNSDGESTYEGSSAGGLNSGGYQQALAAFNASKATAEANKAARDRLYSGLETSVRDLNMGNLNTEFSTAGREVNFDAARRGLYGGSAYADQLGTLADKRNQGLLKITDAATGAANEARAADDRTRLGLARDITSGLDESTALASAANQMDSNVTAARTAATAGSLSGFFDSVLSNLHRNAQQQGLASAWQKYGGGAMPRQQVTNGNLYQG